jgi:Immunoglobulin I-set domain/PQQ enzyme repeat
MTNRLRASLTSFLLAFISACGGGSTPGVSAPPAVTGPSITSQPQNQTVAVGSSASFSVAAGGTAPLMYQWQKNGTNISGAASSTYTTPATVAGDDGSEFQVVITNAAGSVTSSQAKLTVSATPPATGTTSDITTYKYNVSRTGLNSTETVLTLANVNSTQFGLLRKLVVDGKVDAQPLYLANLTVAGAAHNVVYVATEHGSVWAFDSDTGTKLWQVSLLKSGESPGNNGCSQITPEIGVTSTPVIDRTAGIIYAVAMSKDSSSNYHQRLHALDITTGAEMLGGPTDITASYTGTGTPITFNPAQHAERAGLLLSGGTIYTSWTSHCDVAPYSGWVIAFSASTLARSAILNVAADSQNGPSIWMSGGGPAADSSGNVFLITANGDFDTAMDTNGFPNHGDFGNSFLKISPASAGLTVIDYFAQHDTVARSSQDADLGSGGELLLPDMSDSTGKTRHLMVGAGKDTNIYLVDRDSMGKFNSSTNNIVQTLSGALPGGVWSTPAYFNNTLYFGDVSGTLKAFAITAAKITATPSSQSPTSFIYPGTAASVSADGTANGIVWAHENTSPGVLHAFDASNLSHELYNSNQAANAKDQFGAGNKYITPVVADGKVFVGTTNSVAVFGLR